MAHDQLLTNFAKLGVGKDDDLIRFAATWGLAGYREVRERTVRGSDLGNEGDPVAWLRAHASGVATCLRLIEYLRDESHVGLSNYLRSLPTEAEGEWRKVLVYSGYGAYSDAVPLSFPIDASSEEVARLILAGVINENLGGVRPKMLSAEPEGRLGVYYDYGALLDVIYWQLAQLVVSADKLARCEYCGNYFISKHGKQKYCPPPGSEQNKAYESESLCSRKARAKRKARG